jgi:glycosyltransferase involved in cell wall biosynthesis
MVKYLIFCLTLLVNVHIFATIRILTFHCNQPDFIEMQYKTLKKFLKDEFELIVFNDAKTEENEKGIKNICDKYQIQCVRFKPEWHLTDPLNAYLSRRLQEPSTTGLWGWNASTSVEEFANHPSVRHCHVIQYALDNYGYDHDDIVVIMDGDNFLIRRLSIRELLNGNDIIGFHQRADELATQRKQWNLSVPKSREMLWVVFIAFDPRKLPDVREMKFHVDVVSNHPELPHNTISDTGAAVYKYLWKHPDLKLQAYPWQSSYTYRCFSYEELRNMRISDRLIQFINDIAPGNVQFFVFEHFMHFSAGSFESGDHQHKVRHVRQFIEDILK